MGLGGRLSRFVGSSSEVSGSWVQGSAAQRRAGVVNERDGSREREWPV